MTMVLPSDFFNPKYKLEPWTKHFYTRRTFKYGLLKYSLIFGLLGGYLFTDSAFFNNDFNARPDLNQMRIMTDNLPDKEKKVFEMYNNNYFGKEFEDKPQSWIKKFKERFYKSVHYNPSSSDYIPFYDYKNRSYYPEDISSYYSN